MEKGWKPLARDFSNLVFGTKLKPNLKEGNMEGKLNDWKDDFDLSEDDIVEEITSPSKICFYCRNEVETDYGQTQVWCRYCQTITTAIPQVK